MTDTAGRITISVVIDLPDIAAVIRDLLPVEAAAESTPELTQEITKMAGELDTLTAQVAKNTDVVTSALTLINGFQAQLAAAGTDPVKLSALSDALDASDTALAAAIVANTPAATTNPAPAQTAPAPAAA